MMMMIIIMMAIVIMIMIAMRVILIMSIMRTRQGLNHIVLMIIIMMTQTVYINVTSFGMTSLIMIIKMIIMIFNL